MDWRSVPSLPALRAVEAAGRTGSLSKAAAELNVTHAAIAQHLRTVEGFMGCPLLTRQGRGMALTPQGQQLLPALTTGFAQVIAGVRDVMAEAADAPLSISVTPSFAENWLMPRMGAFWSAHPDITVSVTPSTGLSDLRRDGFDLAVRYGKGDWPGLSSEFLVSADYVVVASPDLLRGRTATSLADLSDLPWLFESMHRETYVWAMSEGLDPACCQTKEVATLSMVLAAARAGAGVAIASKALVSGDITNGTLTAVLEVPQSGLGYFIVRRPGVVSPRLKIFADWLKSAA